MALITETFDQMSSERILSYSMFEKHKIYFEEIQKKMADSLNCSEIKVESEKLLLTKKSVHNIVESHLYFQEITFH